jgi:hypothetical protein
VAKIQEYDEQGRREMVADLSKHTEVLRDLFTTASDRAQRYILLTNGGAVVAMLSFMGASDELRNSHWMWLSLASFLVGVFACGIVAAVTYHRSQVDFLRWISDVGDFVAGKIDAGQPTLNLNGRNTKIGWLAEAFAYVAFGAFIAGVGITLCHMP